MGHRLNGLSSRISAVGLASNSNIRKTLLLCGLMCTFYAHASYPEDTDIRVIAHPSVHTSVLSNSNLRSIFGMRNRTWPEGNMIKVFVLNDNSPTHVDFTKKILQTFPYNLRRIWDRRVYSGTGKSPTTVESEEEMHKLIADTPNSIGYIGGQWVSDEVKVVELK